MVERIKLARRRGETQLSSKNQVTIPLDVVRAGGFETGQRFRVELDVEGRVMLTRTLSKGDERRALLRDWTPILHGDTRAELEEMRNEWDS